MVRVEPGEPGEPGETRIGRAWIGMDSSRILVRRPTGATHTDFGRSSRDPGVKTLEHGMHDPGRLPVVELRSIRRSR